MYLISYLLVLLLLYLRKEHDASVCHGEGKAQDATAHNGVAQVEDRHAEGGMAGMLLRETRERTHIVLAIINDAVVKYIFFGRNPNKS